MASLPSQNTLTHRATLQYGNAVSSHASCGPWKHSCLLQPHATSILIQEHYSSFVNMVLGCSHYLYERQHSTHCSRLTVLSLLAALTHLTELCFMKFFWACKPCSNGISLPDILPKTTFGIFKGCW